jgi:hypothetical protein
MLWSAGGSARARPSAKRLGRAPAWPSRSSSSLKLQKLSPVFDLWSHPLSAVGKALSGLRPLATLGGCAPLSVVGPWLGSPAAAGSSGPLAGVASSRRQ